MTVTLSNAVHCADCDAISAPRRSRCEVCGSQAIYPLWRMLAREPSGYRYIEGIDDLATLERMAKL
jgi:hypothetical protein